MTLCVLDFIGTFYKPKYRYFYSW